MREWKQGMWVGIDTETCGVKATDPICEIGLCGFNAKEDKIVWENSYFVDPGVPIKQEATSVHGISDSDVQGANPIGDYESWICMETCIADVVVAFNWPFDELHLSRELKREWPIYKRSFYVLDPLVVLRFDEVGRYWGGKGRHTLAEACTRLRIPWEGNQHRAGTDAAMACRVLSKLVNFLPDDIEEAAELISAHRAGDTQRFHNYVGASNAISGKEN
jgi:DNA polymerase III epsilon subunit-like protein